MNSVSRSTLLLSVLVLAAAASAGCSWVKVSEAGRKIAILPASRVGDCARVGTIATSVKDDVIGIERSREKVQTELDRLAQDQAVLMNANSLVRVAIRDGKGEYIAYNCP